MGEQTHPSGLEWTEPKAGQYGGSHSDGDSGPGRSLDERSESKSDQESLQPAICGESRKRTFNDLELPGLEGEPIEQDGAESDPSDGTAADGSSEARRV